MMRKEHKDHIVKSFDQELAHRIVEAWQEIKASPPIAGRRPRLWDGRAAERIVEILRRHYGGDAGPSGFERVPEPQIMRHR